MGAALLARIALDGGGPPPAAEARLDATQLEAALAEEAVTLTLTLTLTLNLTLTLTLLGSRAPSS